MATATAKKNTRKSANDKARDELANRINEHMMGLQPAKIVKAIAVHDALIAFGSFTDYDSLWRENWRESNESDVRHGKTRTGGVPKAEVLEAYMNLAMAGILTPNGIQSGWREVLGSISDAKQHAKTHGGASAAALIEKDKQLQETVRAMEAQQRTIAEMQKKMEALAAKMAD